MTNMMKDAEFAEFDALVEALIDNQGFSFEKAYEMATEAIYG
jgi:hypothetical protein